MTTTGSGGWYTFLNILKETRTGANRKPLVACPNDGEPLRAAPDGGMFCPYEGWRPDSTGETV